MADLLLPLAAILTFAFGWNNSSFLVGNMSGSGTLTLRESTALSAIGLLLGVSLEGSKMLSSLNGGIAPLTSNNEILLILGVTIVFTVLLTLVNLPVSFSVALFGAFLGTSYASSLPVKAGQVELIVAFWFLAPILTAALTFGIYTLVSRLASNLSIITVDSMNRAGVIISSLAVAYALGANNIGLIYGFVSGRISGVNDFVTIGGLTLFAVAGMAILGKGGVTGTIGDRMLVLTPLGVLTAFLSSAVILWVGTQLSVPVSITQCIIGGMLGAAYTKSVMVVNNRLALEIVSMWIIVPLAAFLAAFSLTLL